MRCPKCGRMSFEFLETCGNCGRDLKEIRHDLFDLPRVNPELCWFEASQDSTAAVGSAGYAPPPAGEAAGVELASIDLSDLVGADKDRDGTDVLELDLSGLDAVAHDEAFQSALEQVLEKK